MPGAVPGVSAFSQQELLCRIGGCKSEGALCRDIKYALLYAFQFDVQNLPKLLDAKRTKGDNLVEAIHELRRELAACSFQPGATCFATSFLIEQTGTHLLGLHASAESDLRSQQSRHFSRAEITRHE